jgi:hypothetical protein
MSSYSSASTVVENSTSNDQDVGAQDVEVGIQLDLHYQN